MSSPAESAHSSFARDACLASYKDWLAKQDVSLNTLRAYHSRIKQFLIFVEYENIADPTFGEVRSFDEALQLYISFLKETRAAASSINANINALTNFSRFLGLRFTSLERVNCPRKSGTTLSPSEQDNFLRSANQQAFSRDRALGLMLLSTGLRVGECAGLTVGDILLNSDVSNSRNSPIAWLCLDRGIRLELNDSTSAALRRWLDDRSQIPNDGKESGLWLTKDGKRLSIAGIGFVVRRIGWQSRLSVSAETLRRTWLANVTSIPMSNAKLADQFGGYVNQATLTRYGGFLRSP